MRCERKQTKGQLQLLLGRIAYGSLNSRTLLYQHIATRQSLVAISLRTRALRTCRAGEDAAVRLQAKFIANAGIFESHTCFPARTSAQHPSMTAPSNSRYAHTVQPCPARRICSLVSSAAQAFPLRLAPCRAVGDFPSRNPDLWFGSVDDVVRRARAITVGGMAMGCLVWDTNVVYVARLGKAFGGIAGDSPRGEFLALVLFTNVIRCRRTYVTLAFASLFPDLLLNSEYGSSSFAARRAGSTSWLWPVRLIHCHHEPAPIRREVEESGRMVRHGST